MKNNCIYCGKSIEDNCLFYCDEYHKLGYVRIFKEDFIRLNEYSFIIPYLIYEEDPKSKENLIFIHLWLNQLILKNDKFELTDKIKEQILYILNLNMSNKLNIVLYNLVKINAKTSLSKMINYLDDLLGRIPKA